MGGIKVSRSNAANKGVPLTFKGVMSVQGEKKTLDARVYNEMYGQGCYEGCTIIPHWGLKYDSVSRKLLNYCGLKI